jgi:succinyl-CoA synthetase alpha subunit
VSVIYVPPPPAAAAIDEAVDADLDVVISITEVSRDMIRTKHKMQGRTPVDRAQLSGRDHARRIKIGICPGIHRGRSVVSARAHSATKRWVS